MALTPDMLVLGSDLAISPEFAAVLTEIGKPGLEGAVVGAAQIDADISETQAAVPEPTTTLGLLMTGAIGMLGHRALSQK